MKLVSEEEKEEEDQFGSLACSGDAQASTGDDSPPARRAKGVRTTPLALPSSVRGCGGERGKISGLALFFIRDGMGVGGSVFAMDMDEPVVSVTRNTTAGAEGADDDAERSGGGDGLASRRSTSLAGASGREKISVGAVLRVALWCRSRVENEGGGWHGVFAEASRGDVLSPRPLFLSSSF